MTSDGGAERKDGTERKDEQAAAGEKPGGPKIAKRPSMTRAESSDMSHIAFVAVARYFPRSSSLTTTPA